MKRFWLVLLSLGLVMAFSASAFAVDVKFSGSYFAGGMYVNRTSLTDTEGTNGQSTAFYFQRMRLTTEFVVAPGLSLITRANVMERIGGASRSAPGTQASPGPDEGSAATLAENQNIGFDYLYVNYDSPFATLQVGYQNDGPWGTVFGDFSQATFKVGLRKDIGKLRLAFSMWKETENRYTAFNTASTQTDNDYDKYSAYFIYTEKNWNAGMVGAFANNATTRSSNAATSYRTRWYALNPYVKANIGPVFIQAEASYVWGKQKEYDSIGTDVKISSYEYFIDATGTFGPFYVGGTIAYVQGQGSDATVNNTYTNGGRDWSPTLILWNQDRAYWFGTINSPQGAFGTNVGMTNAYLYQVRGGVKPTDKLDVCLALTFSQADTLESAALAGYVSKDYGYEVDVTGTYKITNNLSYMLGVGYLVTGDYFKGTNSNNKVANDYLVTNKLTLTF
ncbi:MAG: hypothetical protein AB2L12_08645 [Smithellaceae bacterium]